MMWSCEKCGREVPERSERCLACGGYKPGVEPKEGDFQLGDEGRFKHITVATIPALPGRTVKKICGVVTGESIMGANVLRELEARISDIFGGRTFMYESGLRACRRSAMETMLEEADSLGANAVIGVDVDYETVRGSMLMTCVSGTAVVVE